MIKEEELYWEVTYGNEEEVKKILKENPAINVNWKHKKHNGFTALHVACSGGHDRMISLLLAHPDINVNQKSLFGATPFLAACFRGKTSAVRLLLKDARAKVNVPGNDGRTPLSGAAFNRDLDVISWFIASGREMDLGQPGKKSDGVGAAREREWTDVISLLERFKANPTQTRGEIRKELRIAG